MKTYKEDVNCTIHNIGYVANVFERGDGSKVYSTCPKCDEERNQDAKKAAEELEKFRRNQLIQKRFKRSGIPPRYTTRTFDNYRANTDAKKKALDTVMNYSKNISANMDSGASLVLAGKPGTGKTHLACAVGCEFINSGNSALFIGVSGMIRRIREAYRKGSEKTEQELINEFRDISLLIIDEIGVQKGTESEENLLFEVINERYNYFKPTILISNLNAEQMKQYIGQRALDRMKENGGAYVAFNWDSYRGEVDKDENLPKADKAIYREGYGNREKEDNYYETII